MRTLLLATVSLTLIVGAVPAIGAPCKDAKGRFAKCPPQAAPKVTRCKAASGKFAKCGTPGAKAI